MKGNSTQKQLADEAEVKQPRISAMERPGEIQFSLETLIRMAAHKVGLRVEFVPFSDMLRLENGFRRDSFAVRSLEQDEEFLNPDSARNENELLVAGPSEDDSNEAASQLAPDAETREPMAKAEARAASAGGWRSLKWLTKTMKTNCRKSRGYSYGFPSRDGSHHEIYSNYLHASWTLFDVRVQLGQLVPARDRPKDFVVEEKAAVTISWSQAKNLRDLLADLVASYEETNGEINRLKLTPDPAGKKKPPWRCVNPSV